MDATREGVTEEGNEVQNEQQEVQAEPVAPPPDSPASRRLAALDAIEDRRLAELAEESGVPRDEPKSEPNVEQKSDQVAEQLADDGFVDADTLHRKVKMVIDGEEVVMPLEQIVRDAQKKGAADKRLAEATELLRQARAGETVGKVEPSAAPGPSHDETVKAKLKDALAAIFSGDEDAATNAFAQVLTARPTQATQVDPDALAEVVTQKLDERSALRGFFEAYPKVASNRYLQAAADDALAHYTREGKDFASALELAGQAVYQQFGYERDNKAAPEKPATTRQVDVAARKASMDIPVGRTTSAAQTRNAPESSEAERSQTIAEMAAARRGEMTGARR